MTDRDALLAAVVAAPDDDTPRLIYADWLEEHGQPERAEFIRVQCEMEGFQAPPPEQRPSCRLRGEASIRPKRDHVRRCDWCQWEQAGRFARLDHLQQRELELLPAALHSLPLRGRWVGDLLRAQKAADAGPVVYFARGFVDVVQGAIGLVREALPALVAREPVRVALATDRSPWRVPDRGPVARAWGWFTDPARESHHLVDAGDMLPDGVFRRMPPGVPHADGIGRYYPTHDDALAALSAGLLLEARERAGLVVAAG